MLEGCVKDLYSGGCAILHILCHINLHFLLRSKGSPLAAYNERHSQGADRQVHLKGNHEFRQIRCHKDRMFTRIFAES